MLLQLPKHHQQNHQNITNNEADDDDNMWTNNEAGDGDNNRGYEFTSSSSGPGYNKACSFNFTRLFFKKY